ncbi:uncharacterized protein VTP21DRAFT_6954 [Calcarisporiella thermophila]|uniref:uncharacterized protein n=1 Tax=Calcarisporiella thermophila TaxID=911321 RepID=UPI003741FC55
MYMQDTENAPVPEQSSAQVHCLDIRPLPTLPSSDACQDRIDPLKASSKNLPKEDPATAYLDEYRITYFPRISIALTTLLQTHCSWFAGIALILHYAVSEEGAGDDFCLLPRRTDQRGLEVGLAPTASSMGCSGIGHKKYVWRMGGGLLDPVESFDVDSDYDNDLIQFGAGEKHDSTTLTLQAIVVTGNVILTLLTGLSRVYLGVHYLHDVLFGWLAGCITAIIGHLLFNHAHRSNAERLVIGIIAPCICFGLLFIVRWALPAEESRVRAEWERVALDRLREYRKRAKRVEAMRDPNTFDTETCGQVNYPRDIKHTLHPRSIRRYLLPFGITTGIAIGREILRDFLLSGRQYEEKCSNLSHGLQVAVGLTGLLILIVPVWSLSTALKFRNPNALFYVAKVLCSFAIALWISCVSQALFLVGRARYSNQCIH